MRQTPIILSEKEITEKEKKEKQKEKENEKNEKNEKEKMRKEEKRKSKSPHMEENMVKSHMRGFGIVRRREDLEKC